MCSTDCFLALLAILFPPIAVWVKRGVCSGDSFINIALCCLGYLPGLLHAWYIISRYPDESLYIIEEAESNPHHHHHGQRRYHSRVYYFPAAASAPQTYNTFGHSNSPSPAPQGCPHHTPTPAPSNHHHQGLNSPAAYSAQQQQTSDPAPSDAAPPPSYSDAVKGDHKIQTQE